jgi:signal transduction histidine kinase
MSSSRVSGWFRDDPKQAARQMNFSVKLRLTALGVALALMGALIVIVTLSSQQMAEEARNHLGQVDLESMRISDRFKDKVRFANDQMHRFTIARDNAAWDDFVKAVEDIKDWVRGQAPALTTPLEREILRKMESACDSYTQYAKGIKARMARTGEASASIPEYDGFLQQTRLLRDLGLDLARVHYESRNEVLAEANRTLTQLRLSVLGLVGLLFLFAIALSAGVYRHMIAPLRVRLVESQALAESNEKLASLGLLAASVAHEIRNPLTAIKAALFIQQKKLKSGSADEGDVKLVEKEIVRLERIVNDFLLFARPADPELALLTADQPLREVQALLATPLSKVGIRLVREEPAALRLRADLEQLKQVLINLVQNAADSTDEGGIVTLRARRDRKRLSTGETDVVVLEVSDRGRGIPPEVEKRLFDPFFTTKENGTGLGLSIAARIVEKQGGALQYQTRLNHGTTFGIILPEVKA